MHKAVMSQWLMFWRGLYLYVIGGGRYVSAGAFVVIGVKTDESESVSAIHTHLSKDDECYRQSTVGECKHRHTRHCPAPPSYPCL